MRFGNHQVLKENEMSDTDMPDPEDIACVYLLQRKQNEIDNLRSVLRELAEDPNAYTSYELKIIATPRLRKGAI
jgi:hypothetical protein